MTQQQAESVKDLAKETTEVLEVITERKCSQCKGLKIGAMDIDGRVAVHLPCNKCNGTGKLSWKWEPKPRDYVTFEIDKNRSTYLGPEYGSIYDVVGFIIKVENGLIDVEYYDDGKWRTAKDLTIDELYYIPDWEEIERVLEGVEYEPYFERHSIPNILEYPPWFYEIRLPTKLGCYDIIRGEGKSRQEAVMRAVIKLGEEINAGSR